MSTSFLANAAPEPPTRLGRYRVLAPSAGVRVSPLVFGGMSLGSKWAASMGQMDKESSFKLLDAYFEAGGNFIDTANIYQSGESEEIIGEWMEERGVRDQIFLATKYTLGYKNSDDTVKQKINFVGNNIKSMRMSVEDSLKKLRTSYIDLLYVHLWDYDTPVEEVMGGLHNLVTQGKVLYLGISDTPAWVVSKANQYARMIGKTPFCVYQGAWSLIQRDIERDIIPMCRSEGMGIIPWNVMAGGRLRSDAEEKRRAESGEGGRKLNRPDWQRTEIERKAASALEKVGKELGDDISVAAVAIAYVMHKTPYVFPLVGGRKISQLQDNIKALSITLTPKQMEYLDSEAPFIPGFPHWMIGDGTSTTPVVLGASQVDRVPLAAPYTPNITE